MELWLKLNMTLDSPYKSLDSKMELKVDKVLLGKDLLNIAQKLCIQVWN